MNELLRLFCPKWHREVPDGDYVWGRIIHTAYTSGDEAYHAVVLEDGLMKTLGEFASDQQARKAIEDYYKALSERAV